MKTKHRNTRAAVAEASPHFERAIQSQLMQVSIRNRRGKTVELPNGSKVVEFVNCSYLGLDTHPDVVAGARDVLDGWGVHFCCARSRFSIDPLRQLEEQLSEHFGARAITFPSVTSAHQSALPLVASGALWPGSGRVRLIFDRFAHASMQFLKPILSTEATVVTVGHNALDQVLEQVHQAHEHQETPVLVADGVYSMGGAIPVEEVMKLSVEHRFKLYVDDAHGTSIFGKRGQGYVLSRLQAFPENLLLCFSLAKGFGCNGGGILVPDKNTERLIRCHGQTYAFSGPLDFAIVGAAQQSLRLHQDGTVSQLQQRLWSNVHHFAGPPRHGVVPSPIQMVKVGTEMDAIAMGEALLERGFFVSTAFFPVVARADAQLRICITAEHTVEELDELKRALAELGA